METARHRRRDKLLLPLELVQISHKRNLPLMAKKYGMMRTRGITNQPTTKTVRISAVAAEVVAAEGTAVGQIGSKTSYTLWPKNWKRAHWMGVKFGVTGLW